MLALAIGGTALGTTAHDDAIGQPDATSPSASAFSPATASDAPSPNRVTPRPSGVGDMPAIGGPLRPGGFERPHWRSFAHVRPQLAPGAGRVRVPVFTVAIDPGHGGSDPGARGPNGLLEKHLTLDIARRVKLFLAEIPDIRAVLTRERDHGLSRRARVAAVRDGGADLFVSLHFNHLPQSELVLVESFYAAPENIRESLRERARAAASGREASDGTLPARHAPLELPDLDFARGSARFAALVQRRVFDEIGFDNERARDAGTKRDTLFVLTRSLTSGALVELTCLSNVEEAERLTEAAYRDRIAAALADAIRDYRASLDAHPLGGEV